MRESAVNVEVSPLDRINENCERKRNDKGTVIDRQIDIDILQDYIYKHI